MRCRFKRSGAARQVQARREARQQQRMEGFHSAFEAKIKIASKAEWKLKKREVELKAAAARVTELELHKAVHNQWASGAGRSSCCTANCSASSRRMQERRRSVG